MIRKHIRRAATGLAIAALLVVAAPATVQAAEGDSFSSYTSCPAGKTVKVTARTTTWTWLYLREKPNVLFHSKYYLGRYNGDKSYTTSWRTTYWTVSSEGPITYAYGQCV